MKQAKFSYFIFSNPSYVEEVIVKMGGIIIFIRDHHQTVFLILSEFKGILISIPLEIIRKYRLSDGFNGNRNLLVRLNSLNIRIKIWRRSLILLMIYSLFSSSSF